MPPVVAQCTFTTTLARTRNQLFGRGAFAAVHSCCRKFFKHVHNLFTHALWLPSPVGLRLEISCESDKKKMNLIFDCDKKFSLTEKMKHACRRKKKKRCVKKFRARQPRLIRNRCDEETSLLIVCASRVDRLSLCGQFPASASGGQTLSKM
jgi:hypothetical protein